MQALPPHHKGMGRRNGGIHLPGHLPTRIHFPRTGLWVSFAAGPDLKPKAGEMQAQLA